MTIWELHQYGPHVVTAKRSNSSSFVWTGTSSHILCQGHCIHQYVSHQNALWPHAPDASVISVMHGVCMDATACIINCSRCLKSNPTKPSLIWSQVSGGPNGPDAELCWLHQWSAGGIYGLGQRVTICQSGKAVLISLPPSWMTKMLTGGVVQPVFNQSSFW